MIYLELFIAFLQVGLFAVGGGYAAIPLIQSQAVGTYGWLTMNEFTDLVTIAEMTPGPIAVNAATFVGIRVAGIPGALAATFGSIFPALVIVSVLSLFYAKYRQLPLLQSVLAMLRPAVVALIASAGLSILLQVVFAAGADITLEAVQIVGVILFAAALFVLRTWKLNPILVMASCGVVNLLVGLIFG